MFTKNKVLQVYKDLQWERFPLPSQLALSSPSFQGQCVNTVQGHLSTWGMTILVRHSSELAYMAFVLQCLVYV